MSRELQFTYGSLTVRDESTRREITGWTLHTIRFEQATFECDFVMWEDSEPAFKSAINVVEDAFRKPFQDFTFTQGAQTIYSYKQSDNTGLDAKPEILSREDDATTGRSRKYRVRIVFGLPANTGAELNSGLREHAVEVHYDPNRIRRVSITGMFTAVSTNNARQQYEAQIDALENAVFSALGITAANRELIEEPEANHSYNTKTITFRRVWRELKFSQGGAVNEDAAIKLQVLRIERVFEAPGDVPTVDRLATMNVRYDCWADTNVVGSGSALRQLYDRIRPWIVDQVIATLGRGPVAMVEEAPEFNYDEYRLSVRMQLKGKGKSNTLSRRISIQDHFEPGWVLVPAWTGDPMSRYDYVGVATRRLTITDTATYFGTIEFTGADLKSLSPIFQGTGLKPPTPPQGLQIRHISSEPTYEQKTLGRQGFTMPITEVTKVDVFEYFKPIPHINTIYTLGTR